MWIIRIKLDAYVCFWALIVETSQRRSTYMYIQNFIMEYSVESIFPVNANGLHNITQWKTKPIR